jgi:precorrin-2 dehydrogenase / sirohydrochlorin ferrochelatase
MPRPYTISLKIDNKPCLVVGGGEVAERKIKTLLDAGARVTVVAREAGEGIEKLAQAGVVTLIRRSVAEADATGKFLVIAATDEHDTNREIAGRARQAGALVNVADSPEESDFFVPATIERGDLTIAISTGGKIPALSRRIREQLEAQFGAEYGQYVELLEEARKKIYASSAAGHTEKQRLLGEAAALDLIPLLREHKRAQARTIVHSFLKQHGIEQDS